MKFVHLTALDGATVPVNPDRVACVLRRRDGATAVRFGALPGGVDELAVRGSVDQVVAALEGDNPGLAAVLGAMALAGAP